MEINIEHLSAELINYDNGWYTIDIKYKGKTIKRISR